MIQLAFAAHRQLSIWWLKATAIYYYSLMPGGQLRGWAQVAFCSRLGHLSWDSSVSCGALS